MADSSTTETSIFQVNSQLDDQNSRLNYENYINEDSEGSYSDGNSTSSDSDEEAAGSSWKRKRGVKRTKSQASTGDLHNQRTRPGRRSKFLSLNILQAMYCCAWLCLARCATSMVDEVNCVREQVVLEYKQWVMNYLHLHKQENHENSTIEFVFMIGTTVICLDAWLQVIGLPLSSFYKIRQMVLNGVKHAPASIGRLYRWDTKTYAAMAWFGRFAEQYGDYQPDSSKLHLPMCLMTKTAVYEFMVQEMKAIGEKDFISFAHFVKLWREQMHHICLPKVSTFSVCDKCMKHKKNLQESKSNLERDYWRGKRERHLRKQKLQRDKYAKHASKAKNQPSKYLSIILDGMDQNKTAIPHFSRHSKTTQGIWKLKTHLTGAILHGKGILGFFDVGQFKHDSNLNIAVLMNILQRLTCFPPVLYLQMDNCWKDNKNRFLIGFLSLLVHLGIFRKVKLGYLMVGHTHEDVDRVFSRFSKTLRFNGAPTLDGLLNLWERSQVPAPTGINLQRTWNVKQWLIPCLDSMERHSKPHCFKMVRNEDGMVEIFWKKWATDKEWINAGALLLMKPGGEPQIVRASYDQILLKRLQEDIVGKAGPFLKDEDKHWWGEFFKSVNEQETDQELPEWALDRLCKIVKETREKEVEEEPVPFETTHSDEDDPIPPVIIGSKKKKGR